MKNLTISIFAFLAFFAASFTINTSTVSAKTDAVVTSTVNVPYNVVVYQGNLKITYLYDGPGGKLINVMIEHID